MCSLTLLFSQLPSAALPREGNDASELAVLQPPQGRRLRKNLSEDSLEHYKELYKIFQSYSERVICTVLVK